MSEFNNANPTPVTSTDDSASGAAVASSAASSQGEEGKRRTTTINLPNVSPGCRKSLVYHTYGPKDTPRVYIQASLHADELPGMVVAHHLIKLLDIAARNNEILQEIVIVPYANPIGLSQGFMERHLGRFSFETMVNFNRNWFDLSQKVCERVENRLSVNNPHENVTTIREVLAECINEVVVHREEEIMKKELFKLAAVADIVLDLHCDAVALMHIYTHDACWPSFKDLAIELQSYAQLLASCSGGNPFDEACSVVWAVVAEKYPDYPIPMGCQSATVELRGTLDVSDDLASKDAAALFRFLQGRGYIAQESCPQTASPTPLSLLYDGSPLTGVDDLVSDHSGVVVWKCNLGDVVVVGQLLGEMINIEDVDAPRIPLHSRCNGVVLTFNDNRLVRPGQRLAKIVSEEPLEWRQGDLLSL